MSEEKKPFTVSDRRHFTPEGEARDAQVDASTEEGKRAAASPQASPPGNRGTQGPPTASLVGLFLSLGAQAGLLLAPPAEEGGEPPPPDLEGARQIVGLLELLKDRTEGRRTAEEDQVLEGLLYQLRMEYVSRSRVAAR